MDEIVQIYLKIVIANFGAHKVIHICKVTYVAQWEIVGKIPTCGATHVNIKCVVLSFG